MSNVTSAFTGKYEIGVMSDADCVIGHSFGTSTEPGSVNAHLAELAANLADRTPLIMDETLALSLPVGHYRVPNLNVKGKVSNLQGDGIGTWGVLVAAQKFMEEHDLHRPLMVAQAFHVGRVALQAQKLGMEPVLPQHMPRDFDPKSKQLWTRSRALWMAFTPAIMVRLKIKDQL